MRKKVDQRIQILMENCIKLRQRGFFIIVGDRGKEQVVNIHYLLNKMNFKSKPNVLWCYKKELGFSTNKQKRMKEIKKLQKKGLYDNNVDDPFQLFVTSTQIRYCYYKETHKILGQTYQMLILQDFEAITPNVLCRTIETVEGGGFVIMLFKTMSSLKQLYTLTMDVHNRFRTDQFQDVEPRFNERFILSLSKSENTIVMDDELNILPISNLIENIKSVTADDSLDSKMTKELEELKDSLKQNVLVGPFINIAKTLDQARAIMTFIDAITEKNTRATISLTAGRGRGKSAAVGVAIAAAVVCGFSNIYVTAPSPENLNTLFEFIFNGLEQNNYKENMHYDIIQSTNPDFNNAVIRVNVFKTHKQIIQYVSPTDFASIGHADLVVIDEAAAIPLVYVKQFLGPHLVFLCSTVNGYEGTGRSLSLKLIQQLKSQSKMNTSSNSEEKSSSVSSSGSRVLKELTLNDPIRYSPNDPIERWLNDLLCLEASQAVPLKSGLPHPNDCELFMVNRDTLFSYKKSTEQFLFNLMSLFISSHYKNSPNDLQLLSDAPSHAVFVLMGKIKEGEKKSEMPDILCAVQVALEGKISKETFNQQSENRVRPAGDLIPWIISEQFQDREFPSLSGVRVVRIATHPAAQKMGYGSKSLELLQKFFEGELIDLSNETLNRENYFLKAQRTADGEKKLKPLLKRLTEIEPPQLHYLGVSFGLSKELFKFWKKSGYYPLYLRQAKNDITAEHSCIMLKSLKKQNEMETENAEENKFNDQWLKYYSDDFKKRFLQLLSYEFKDVDVQLSLGVVDPTFVTDDNDSRLTNDLGLGDKDKNQIGNYIMSAISNKEQLENYINTYDLKRLEAYSRNLADFYLIIDLLPEISKMLFLNRLQSIKMSYSQCAIFLGLGLQHKSIEKLARELGIPVSQVMAIFNKGIRKITQLFRSLFEQDIMKDMNFGNSKEALEKMNPIKDNENEIQDAGKEYLKSLLEKDNKQDEKEDKKSDKLNKKRHARYNFSTDDIDVGNASINQNTGTITIARDSKVALNQDFTNYKSASAAQAAAAAKNAKKKLKKN
ncbi:hypothetical protein ABPG74_002067 [Tetrahymena malaccensis]